MIFINGITIHVITQDVTGIIFLRAKVMIAQADILKIVEPLTRLDLD